jgi:SSS family solute:Na+ symporter
LQAVLIVIGGLVITYLAWSQIPSWQAVRDASPPGALDLIRPTSDSFLPWPGLVTGVFIIGFYFWCTNQFIIQRTLAAKSLNHARWGSLFAGFLKLPNLFILVLPGVMATYLYPDLKRPDLVFPVLAFGLLPIGLRGLMLAALAAAILSSLEAIFNSASTLLTMDFVRTLRPRTSDRALEQVGRWSTLGFMFVSAMWAPVIRGFPTLWEYLQSILAYTTPPAVVVFTFGLFWPRASRAGSFLALAIGIPLGIVGWVMIEIVAGAPLQMLYACGIMFLIACALHATGSLLWPAEVTPEVESCLWRARMWREETRELRALPWWKNYRAISAVLAACTAAIVVWWW